MILLPFTHDVPAETLTAVATWPHLLADVSASDSAYFELLAEWWGSDERELMTIEHDIVVDVVGIREMLNCQEQWCAAWYPFEAGELYGLGCTKFARSIRLAVPDLFDRVGEISFTVHPPKHWCSMDFLITHTVLRERGFTPHLHRLDGIRHLSKVRSHVACR
jgi:hypothetical protein